MQKNDKIEQLRNIDWAGYDIDILDDILRLLNEKKTIYEIKSYQCDSCFYKSREQSRVGRMRDDRYYND